MTLRPFGAEEPPLPESVTALGGSVVRRPPQPVVHRQPRLARRRQRHHHPPHPGRVQLVQRRVQPGRGPPGRIGSTRPPRPRNTCPAVVGDSSAERLALGAATGTPAASSSARATGCAGTRTATVGPPAVTASGTAAAFASTSVSG